MHSGGLAAGPCLIGLIYQIPVPSPHHSHLHSQPHAGGEVMEWEAAVVLVECPLQTVASFVITTHPASHTLTLITSPPLTTYTLAQIHQLELSPAPYSPAISSDETQSDGEQPAGLYTTSNFITMEKRPHPPDLTLQEGNKQLLRRATHSPGLRARVRPPRCCHAPCCAVARECSGMEVECTSR